MLSREMKFRKKTEKLHQLETGRRQFCGISNPERRVYVWVGNVTLPVLMEK